MASYGSKRSFLLIFSARDVLVKVSWKSDTRKCQNQLTPPYFDQLSEGHQPLCAGNIQIQCNLKGLVHLVAKGGLSLMWQARPTTVDTGQQPVRFWPIMTKKRWLGRTKTTKKIIILQARPTKVVTGRGQPVTPWQRQHQYHDQKIQRQRKSYNFSKAPAPGCLQPTSQESHSLTSTISTTRWCWWCYWW